MSGPRVPDSAFTEREGINAVAKAFNQMRCLWREIERHDVGVDGQAELVLDDGTASAQIIAVQVKSGESYFDEQVGNSVVLRPMPKHVEYWLRYPLPIALVLYRPSTNQIAWAHVKTQLHANPTLPIYIPLDSELVPDCRDRLFAPSASTAYSPIKCILEMVQTRYPGPADLTLFSLFTNGLTDLGRKVYFGMDLFHILLEEAWSNDLHREGVGPGWGEEAYLFIDEYVSFLIRNDLAMVNWQDYWQVVVERQMVGTFIATLTERGLQLIQAIDALQSQIDTNTTVRVVQERSIAMEFAGMGAFRIPYIRDFAHQLEERLSG